MIGFLIFVAIFAVLALAVVIWQLRKHSLHPWIWTYVAESPRRRNPKSGQSVHLLLCIADHYEPRHEAPPNVALARVERWAREYPKLFGDFRDSDDRPPRHTFFYPLEQYDPHEVDCLAELCRQGFGEVEVHLHHDRSNPERMRNRLTWFKELLAERHGLLARYRNNGDVAYGFVHGDWALDNSHPQGLCCGVQNELEVLRQTGCYADFTMPSAPNEPTQTRKINSIYYAVGDPHRTKSHDWGRNVGQGSAPANALLLIQGPLLFNWQSRKWGLVPRVENGCIQGTQPPRVERVPLWLKARVQVPARPDWFFVKLHAHGAPESSQKVLLGEPMVRFHEGLARLAQNDSSFHFHYVTAREMFNLAKAAEDGFSGDVAEALDYLLTWNGGRSKSPETNHIQLDPVEAAPALQQPV
jgi:hypothetical protein